MKITQNFYRFMGHYLDNNMKGNKFELFVIIFLIIVFSNGCQKSDIIDKPEKHTYFEADIYDGNADAYGKPDYPLIDIIFEDESAWTIIIQDDYSGNDNEYIWISQERELLNDNKEHLRLTTFPVGRGTTPNGYIHIYKNADLIKSVPYTELEFGNEKIRDSFFKCSVYEIEEKLKISIPPFV